MRCPLHEGPLHCPSPLLGQERLLAEQVAPRIGTTGGLGQGACSQEISAGGLDGAGGQAVQWRGQVPPTKLYFGHGAGRDCQFV